MQKRLQELQQMLAQEPNDLFLQYAIAIEYYSSSEFDKALDCLKKIRVFDPNYLAAYYQSGKCCEELKKFEDAKEFYSQGIEIALKQGKTKTLNELREALFLLEDD
jgi:tetratricopeptide (TPR) repeat protein